MSPDVCLSQNNEEAYFYIDPLAGSKGTAGVRGNKGFRTGEHYWEVIFLEPPYGTSVMVGIGTENAALLTSNYQYIDLIGRDKESWGLSYKGKLWHNGVYKKYCKPFYSRNTVIGCHLNLYTGTLTFYKDGVSLGKAFDGLPMDDEVIYPMVSSTCAETELGLGKRLCSYTSLQEKCCHIIRNNVSCCDNVDYLSLPTMFRNHIKTL